MKIQIVMLSKDEGCAYYRLWLPHKDWPNVEFVQDSPEKFDCDILIFHKGWINPVAITDAQKEGIKVIVDFDDWIEVPEDHVLKDTYNINVQMFISCLKKANLVITTTELLRKELLQFNKNIEVIPNALGPQKMEHKDRDLMTFGYTGGKCHLPDIQQLRGLMGRLQDDIFTRRQFYFALFGYDPNSEIKRQYASILSDNGKYAPFVKPYPLRRATEFLPMYNYIDVSMIPLNDNLFNRMKSPVKLIEAGWYGKGVIVQNIEPYTSWLTDENSIRINNKFQWQMAVKKCIQNPNMVEAMARALCEDCFELFNLGKWNITRRQIYEELLK